MAITMEQIQEAQEKLNIVQRAASAINEILVRVQEDIGIPGVSLTSTQKTDLLAKYQDAKAELEAAVKNLI